MFFAVSAIGMPRYGGAGATEIRASNGVTDI
jgi:hypothetical protein